MGPQPHAVGPWPTALFCTRHLAPEERQKNDEMVPLAQILSPLSGLASRKSTFPSAMGRRHCAVASFGAILRVTGISRPKRCGQTSVRREILPAGRQAEISPRDALHRMSCIACRYSLYCLLLKGHSRPARAPQPTRTSRTAARCATGCDFPHLAWQSVSAWAAFAN